MQYILMALFALGIVAVDQYTKYLTGRDIEDDYFIPKNISEEPVLSVKNLSIDRRVKDVSFDLHKGEILGITGLLGSGRTELALALFGLEKPTAGEIILNGNKVKIKNLANGAIMEYTIVGESEANLKEGKLAAQTPIGKALIGKKKGDVVEVSVPSGILKFEIVDISI